MNITVLGCGKIGLTFIETFVAEGHNVTAIDNNAKLVEDIVNQQDCMGICGPGTDYDTLAEANVSDCELFIATTGSDEFNMLSCFLAKRMGAKHTVARIRNPEYNDKNLGFMRQQLGIDMAINPELLVAGALFNVLKLPSADKIETFARRSFEMIEFRLKNDSSLDGLSLIEMRKTYKGKYLICAVMRDEEVFIPDGNFVLKSGDRISLTASPAEIEKLLKSLGIMQKQSKNIMILGATKTSYYLAKKLLKSGCNVKIIDPSRERCNEFCEALPEAVLICGDATHQDVLIEEGIRNTDAFVALTGMDEENILLSLFASNQNVSKVVAKVNRDEFAAMADSIGINSTISPQRVVTDIIVRYARALDNSIGSKMETLYKILDAKAEALEFLVQSDCTLLDTPLKELKLKKNTLIAGIIRNRKPFIPSGDDCICKGDMVVVLAAGHRINDLSNILK